MASKAGVLLLVTCIKNFEESPLPSDTPFPTDRLILISQGIDNSGNAATLSHPRYLVAH